MHNDKKPETDLKVAHESTREASDTHGDSVQGNANWRKELLGLLRSKLAIYIAVGLFGVIGLREVINIWLHKAAVAQIPVVRVATVVKKTMDQSIELPGNVEAIEEASIFSHVSGYLKKIYVDEGDEVKKGQLLAEIESPEATQEFARAKADNTLQEVTRKRYLALLKEQVISQQEFDVIEATANESNAKFSNAASTLDYTKIRAPFDGSIARRYKYPGDLISTGAEGKAQSPIFLVVNESKLRVATNVPQSDSAFVQVGHPADIKVDTLQDKMYNGTVSRVDAVLDESTKTQRVLIDIDNADGKLHAGMFATVKLEMQHHNDALVIPNEALIRRDDQTFVYTLDNNKVKKVSVKAGYADVSSIEILSGLQPGETVVLPGTMTLTEGMDVKPEVMAAAKVEDSADLPAESKSEPKPALAETPKSEEK